jgi:hypothetical protein
MGLAAPTAKNKQDGSREGAKLAKKKDGADATDNIRAAGEVDTGPRNQSLPR